MSHSARPNLSTFDVPTLARFVRVNYGAAAHDEAARRIAVYVHENQRDLAEVWSLILDDIRKAQAQKSEDV
jgi:hypothetical protein